MIEQIKLIQAKWNLGHNDFSADFCKSTDFQLYKFYELWSCETKYIAALFSHNENIIQETKSRFAKIINQFTDNDEYIVINSQNQLLKIPVNHDLKDKVKNLKSKYADEFNY